MKKDQLFYTLGDEFKVFIVKKDKKEITRNLKECAFIAVPSVFLGILVHISTLYLGGTEGPLLWF